MNSRATQSPRSPVVPITRSTPHRSTLKEYCGPLSRESIAVLGSMRLATVCSAVNALMKEGALVPAGSTWNDETKRNVQLVKLAGAVLSAEVH